MRRKNYRLPLTAERADVLDELTSLTTARKSTDLIIREMRKREEIIKSPNWPALELELFQQRDVLDEAIHDCRLRLLGQLPMWDWR